MKRLLLFSLFVFSLSSCDFIMKDRTDDNTEINSEKKVVLGTDKDDKGCVTSAGYKWSILRKECIRAFEEGYRLNSIDELEGESIAKSAFVIFEEEGDQAELFLPNNTNSVILKKEDNKGDYSNGPWKLQAKNGYQLQNNGRLLFAGAKIQEVQIIGSDQPEG